MRYDNEIEESKIFGYEDFEKLEESIRTGKGPDAIVANKCDSAQWLINFLFDRGVKVPDNISIIAANSEPFAKFLYPPLSVIEIPLREMGKIGVKILLKNISGKTAGSKIKLPNHIIERKSCKRK